MRKLIRLLSLLLVLIPYSPRLPATPRAASAPAPEPDEGAVVCPPGVYSAAPSGCVPLGPSEYLTGLAADGIPYPAPPLPAYAPDPGLVDIPYQYFALNKDEVFYLFSSLDDAMSSSTSGQHLGPGEVYVSYDERVENDSGVFYHLRSGYWVRGDFGARQGLHKPFQGLLFSSTPHNAFGWVMGDVSSHTAPSFSAPNVREYHRYNVVQVYGTQDAEGITWVRLGENEWMDYRQVARVTPRSQPPDGITGARWIEVNLDEQTLAVYQDDKLIFASLVSSGIENLWTRPGIFKIYEKKDSEDMSGSTAADGSDAYHVEDVPWTMYFDEKRALHGAYWHDRFGYPNSHGCVNLSLGDAHWLYNWASVGDQVYVYDPSGHTPTDPALFGNGAP